jgi:hypothetical protein
LGDDGTAERVPTEGLAELFGILRDSIPLRCVVLNACFTEEQARTIAQSVDCVIGTTAAVRDDAAIAFSAAFYRALGEGASLAIAFELGRNAVRTRGFGDPDVFQRWCRDGVDPAALVLAEASPPAVVGAPQLGIADARASRPDRRVVDTFAELYPDPAGVRSIWQRAGGRVGDVPHGTERPRDLWWELWRQSLLGGSARPTRLLQEALHDAPDNAVLKEALDTIDPDRAT